MVKIAKRFLPFLGICAALRAAQMVFSKNKKGWRLAPPFFIF